MWLFYINQFEPIWASFTFTKVNIDISLIIIHWILTHFKHHMPKANTFINPQKFDQFKIIIDYNVVTMVPKLLPSCFMKPITWWINSIFSSKDWSYKTMALPLVSCISNNLTLTCLSFQTSSKQLMTKKIKCWCHL